MRDFTKDYGYFDKYMALKMIMLYYGYENQREQFIEECAEAVQAAQKCKRYGTKEDLEKFKGEIADNIIMSTQLSMYLGEGDIEDIIHDKLQRQLDRIAEREGADILGKLKAQIIEASQDEEQG